MAWLWGSTQQTPQRQQQQQQQQQQAPQPARIGGEGSTTTSDSSTSLGWMTVTSGSWIPWNYTTGGQSTAGSATTGGSIDLGTAAAAATTTGGAAVGDGNSSSSWWQWSPWNQASESVTYATEATYSTLTGAVSSLYKETTYAWTGSSNSNNPDQQPQPMLKSRSISGSSWSSSDDSPPSPFGYGGGPQGASPSLILSLQRQQGRRQRKRQRGRMHQQQQQQNPDRSNSSNNVDLTFTLFQNPYQSVRGRHYHRESMSAIRNFINLVPDVNEDIFVDDEGDEEEDEASDGFVPRHTAGEDGMIRAPESLQIPNIDKQQQQQQPGLDLEEGGDVTETAATAAAAAAAVDPLSLSWQQQQQQLRRQQQQQQQQYEREEGAISRIDATAETAAHLAEGTVRAWRDLCLEEAVELNSALRFWSDRWEQPGLSFLEAGPQVWMSEHGYNHRQVGKRVAQIQAVLARRCAAIGELQQHLLQAGWQKGVAQWGVLGQGTGLWATVAGFDGSIPTDPPPPPHQFREHQGGGGGGGSHDANPMRGMDEEEDATDVMLVEPTMSHSSTPAWTRRLSDPGTRISFRPTMRSNTATATTTATTATTAKPSSSPPPPPTTTTTTAEVDAEIGEEKTITTPTRPTPMTQSTPLRPMDEVVEEEFAREQEEDDDITGYQSPPRLLHSEASRIGGNVVSTDSGGRRGEAGGGGADVFVRKRHGGGIFVDDPAFLARWSVDAIALVRRQLFRAANGTLPLPYASNWVSNNNNNNNTPPPLSPNPLHEENPTSGVDGVNTGGDAEGDEQKEDSDLVFDEADEDENLIVAPAPQSSTTKTVLPLWALDIGQQLLQQQPQQRVSSETEMASVETGGTATKPLPQILIADLPALTDEVSELLNLMEDVMEIQRQRRLNRVQPPNWFRRNWYLIASGVPLALWLVRHGRLRILFSSVVRTIKFFVVERIQGPLTAIFQELWKGRTSFSDRKAHKEAIEVLKKMIKSWLDESYPNMPEDKRQRLADAMDVSLVEQKKEQSMKSLGFNTFDVVRMSFIEMQWLKKEMMNALDAMDEVMSANDINMNLAAITPVFMAIYMQSRVLRYLFYALLRLGRSREDTYASFRAVVMDIERLLVMRDNPPDAREPGSSSSSSSSAPCVLGADDLGMLMLLIHECRTILYQERRRFAPSLIRSVSEDLAELAGERGAVSVKQQLQIVTRMTRSYPFLKVISTGHFFGSQLRRV